METLLPAASIWQSGPVAAGAAAVVGGLTVGLLVACRGALRGSTLIAPYRWTLAAFAALTLVEVAIGLAGADPARFWVAALRYAAAATTFCPLMALLGAKRPQDRGWQWIVATLWVVLVLPAAESLVLGRGGLDVRDFRAWFLGVLLLVGLANALPGRFWPSALLLLGAQVVLLWGHLPGTGRPLGTLGGLLGLTLAAVAAALVACGKPGRRKAGTCEDRLWLDFRDAFGTVWALRVAEQVNAAATRYRWGVSLRWHGFRWTEDGSADIPPGTVDPRVRLDLRRSLQSILRRFVSSAWIAERWPAADEPAQPRA